MDATAKQRDAAEDASIDEVFRRHLSRIVEACRELEPEPAAILLYGSYGRGEGAWFRAEHGGWQPYNDYDVQIVCERPIDPARLAERKEALRAAIGIRWLDLSQQRPEALRRLPPLIQHFDLKYASRVLYGDEHVLDLIPEMRPASLPMRDAEILYFTRMWTLLGALERDGFEVGVEGEASRFFRNQMAKAVLAVLDVILLERGAYDASYRTRVERVVGSLAADEPLVPLARWALEEKLRPRAPGMQPAEVRELYEAVRGQYFPRMYHALSVHFDRPIRGADDVAHAVTRRPAAVARRLYWLIRFRGRSMEQRIRMQLAQSYIAAAYGETDPSSGELRRGIALLRALDPSLPARLDWDTARVTAARMRLALS